MQNGGSITGNPAQFPGGQNAAPLASSNSHSAGGGGGGAGGKNLNVVEEASDTLFDEVRRQLDGEGI